jgi:hypothetical protein
MAPKTRLWLLLVVSSVFVVLGLSIVVIGPDWRLGLGVVCREVRPAEHHALW